MITNTAFTITCIPLFLFRFVVVLTCLTPPRGFRRVSGGHRGPGGDRTERFDSLWILWSHGVLGIERSLHTTLHWFKSIKKKKEKKIGTLFYQAHNGEWYVYTENTDRTVQKVKNYFGALPRLQIFQHIIVDWHCSGCCVKEWEKNTQHTSLFLTENEKQTGI